MIFDYFCRVLFYVVNYVVDPDRNRTVNAVRTVGADYGRRQIPSGFGVAESLVK